MVAGSQIWRPAPQALATVTIYSVAELYGKLQPRTRLRPDHRDDSPGARRLPGRKPTKRGFEIGRIGSVSTLYGAAVGDLRHIGTQAS